MRVFLDTNVLVSAFTARGLCADLFRYLLAEHFHASDRQLAEVEAQLRDHVIVPRPAAAGGLHLRDPDDARVLASAVVGAADLLVTGDKDLLIVAARAPLPILTPREAWQRLRLATQGCRLTRA